MGNLSTGPSSWGSIKRWPSTTCLSGFILPGTRSFRIIRTNPLSKYTLFTAFGWPFETSLAMARLVFSGILEKYPTVKFITHHCGAMIPFFSRACPSGRRGERNPGRRRNSLSLPLEYFKKFYADTVLGGSTPALMCGHAFFGADHMLFGSDYPYPGGADHGDIALGEVIRSVEMMDVTKEEKTGIFSKNTRRILKLV